MRNYSTIMLFLSLGIMNGMMLSQGIYGAQGEVKKSSRDQITSTPSMATIKSYGSCSSDRDISDIKPSNDCGLLALAYIAKELGINKKENEFYDSVIYDITQGATMKQLLDAARKLGLEGQGYRMSFEELTKLKLPLIIYLPRHFTVLTQWDKKNHQLIFNGKEIMSQEVFLKQWQGYVLELWKIPRVPKTP